MAESSSIMIEGIDAHELQAVHAPAVANIYAMYRCRREHHSIASAHCEACAIAEGLAFACACQAWLFHEPLTVQAFDLGKCLARPVLLRMIYMRPRM